jgi:uncharacterized membrane protein YvbJ
MHCPQCGSQQISGKVRFCRACGFSLSGVKELVLPDERAAKAEKKRLETALNQGVGLLLVSLVAAIILTLFQDAHLIPQIWVKIVAAFFVLAGLARMFYPYVIGPASKVERQENLFYESDNQPVTNKLPSWLPSAHSIPVSNFNRRSMDTAKIIEPSSITENTTKSLDNRQD